MMSSRRPGGPERVPRFSSSVRALHWLHAAAFLVLLGTGLITFVPALGGLTGHRFIVRNLHIFMGFVLVLGPIVVFALGDRRGLRRDLGEIDRFDADDVKALKRPWRALSGSAGPYGRFTPAQKLNAIFTAATIVLFFVTGVIMWQFPRFPGWVVRNANFVHDWLTLAAALVWLWHVYFAAVHPSTREALRGITLGWVRADWALQHHEKWYRLGKKTSRDAEE
ncbi:MAG: cytochrome b/b6 domain-containing protein [Chloroflexi bacterium]|nr:cytochrome b/b6 domain-containing protein [Chloroflexota bacterium]